MRCCGVLSVVVKISKMHIPPWYWFRSNLHEDLSGFIIEARPERYMELLRESVAQCARLGNLETAKRRAKRPLHGAAAPSDYGRWCLGEIERAEGNDNLTRFWFEEAWEALRRDEGADGLALEHLELAAASNESLGGVFDTLRATDLHGPLAEMERRDRQVALERR